MKEQELILLGLLKEKPKHGYEIKKEIRNILYLFTGLDLQSIYYPLRILEKKGLIQKSVSRCGKRPARFVYALTPKGESRFHELINRSFLSFKRPQFSLDVSLYFLRYVKPALAKRKLRARQLILKKLYGELKETAESLKKKNPESSLPRILEHNLEMVGAESCFVSQLIKTF
ncbi:MAG: PadR family transcriptional regulator [Candidatus Omnitrophota bacterium]|nr:MAG: PadR family transcriptional regulator [Candidatus Omnitrophota bacterium]